MLCERIGLSVGDVSLAAKDLEIEVKCFIQLSMPIVHQACRYDHQGARQFVSGGEFTQNKRRLDGLAEPHAVSDEEPARRRIGDAMRQDDLMGQQIYFGGCQSSRILKKW